MANWRIENEHPQIQLERDIARGHIIENRDKARFADKPTASYSKYGKKLSDILIDLLKQGGGQVLFHDHQIDWNIDPQSFRCDLACLLVTPNGSENPITDEEQIYIDIHRKDGETEITLQITN